jgi:hypothetical protein
MRHYVSSMTIDCSEEVSVKNFIYSRLVTVFLLFVFVFIGICDVTVAKQQSRRNS